MRVLAALLLLFSLFCREVTAFELSQVWKFPVNEAMAKTTRAYLSGNVKVEEVYYKSRPYKNKEVWIFGYYCYPADAAEKLPAVLLVHGGGGGASLNSAIALAQRGYAVLTIDLPGNGDRRLASRSGGPDMDVSVLLQTKPSLDHNYLIHAVSATRNGITFLTRRKEVDTHRIGMVGLSWGGVITLLTNGQDDRLKTAVNVFGAGYIPEGCTWQDVFNQKSKTDLEEWYKYIDPKNFLKTQQSPIFFITGTNDHCYYLPTFQKSYAEVRVPKNLLLIPNLRHRFMPDTQKMVWLWLDSQLKQKNSFPAPHLYTIYQRNDDKIIVAVTAESTTSATLYYTVGNPSYWTSKRWEAVKGYYENGVYYFGLAPDLVDPELQFFVNVKDQRGAVASIPVRSILRAKLPEAENAYSVCSPIKRMYMHEPPYQIIGTKGLTEFNVKQVYFSKKNRGYYLFCPWPIAPGLVPASRELP